MSRKAIAVSTALVAAALMLAGCGKSDELDRSAATPRPAEPVAPVKSEPPPQASAPAPAPQPDNDQVLASKVKERLAAAPNAAGQGIQVNAAQGVVRLYGTVDTREDKRRIEQLVAAIEGVRSLDSQLRVVAGS